jgi:hypothetical protein
VTSLGTSTSIAGGAGFPASALTCAVIALEWLARGGRMRKHYSKEFPPYVRQQVSWEGISEAGAYVETQTGRLFRIRLKPCWPGPRR